MKARKRGKKYPIPTVLQVGDDWYQVVRYEVIPGCRGTCCYGTKTLNIASRSAGYAYTSLEQFNTFWHELTHAILNDMGSELEADEQFVTAFSDRLTKAITTAKFQE